MSTSLVFDILARDRASTTFRNIGNTADKQTGKLRAFAKIGLMGLAAGGAAAAVGLVKATKAAAEDEAGQARLAAAARNTAKATDGQVKAMESWIGAQGRSLGVTDDELRPAMGRLLTATGDIGEAQKLAALSMDVAAGSGKSLESVSTAVMKAQNGQVSALAKLGIETKDAEGNTLSFEQATAKMADTFGGQASTKAKTFQGTVDRLKLVFGETVETIGAKLLPVLTRMAEWFLAKGIPAIAATWAFLKEKLGPVFATVADIVRTKIVPWFQRFGDTLNTAKSGAQDARPFMDLLKAAFEGLSRVVENVLIPALGFLATNALPVLGAAFKVASKALGAIGKAGLFMWNNILQPVFSSMARAIGKVIQWLANLFGVLASIPGAPAWIGKTSAALDTAAAKARSVADGIKKIESRKVNVDLTVTGMSSLRAAEETIRRLQQAGGTTATNAGRRAYLQTGTSGI